MQIRKQNFTKFPGKTKRIAHVKSEVQNALTYTGSVNQRLWMKTSPRNSCIPALGVQVAGSSKH